MAELLSGDVRDHSTSVGGGARCADTAHHDWEPSNTLKKALSNCHFRTSIQSFGQHRHAVQSRYPVAQVRIYPRRSGPRSRRSPHVHYESTHPTAMPGVEETGEEGRSGQASHIKLETEPPTLRSDAEPSPALTDGKGWDGKLRVPRSALVTNPEAASDSEYSDGENVLKGDEIAADECLLPGDPQTTS